PGDGHDPGRHGDAATVRGLAGRGPERLTAESRARTAVSTATGILRRNTMIVRRGHAWLELSLGASSSDSSGRAWAIRSQRCAPVRAASHADARTRSRAYWWLPASN